MALFPEEKQLMENLIDEWYEAIKKVTEEADSIFGEKGRMYDVNDPVWTRAEWPVGFIHELTKKSNRVKQLMSGVSEVNGFNMKHIIEANEELGDILNYARMMHALNDMLIARWEACRDGPASFCGYCGEEECDCEEDVEEMVTDLLDKGPVVVKYPIGQAIKPGEKRTVGG
jgi:hypothetical protein